MIRKIIYGIYAIIGMMVVTACSSLPDVYEISLEKMQGFPTEDAGFLKGVSALYAGVIDGNLLIAGGCNFPDTPGGRWREKSLLPRCIYNLFVK
ncbi:hypothetical protein NXX77_21180 [Phocaeicola dorei]|nr:hypothetical protein [Phocaeicola dorei]